MIVETAKVIACQEDHCVRPVRTAHKGIENLHAPVFSGACAGRWMLTIELLHDQPAHRGEPPVPGIGSEADRILDVGVPERTVANMVHGVESVPDITRSEHG